MTTAEATREMTTEELREALEVSERRAQHLREERVKLVDALDHIMRTALASRTSTRRLRWIGTRAKSAMDGDDKWKSELIPRHDPLIEKLRELIVTAEGFLGEDLAELIDSYSTRREGSESDRMRSITERQIYDDCIELRAWLEEATRNVPALYERSVKEQPRG